MSWNSPEDSGWGREGGKPNYVYLLVTLIVQLDLNLFFCFCLFNCEKNMVSTAMAAAIAHAKFPKYSTCIKIISEVL